jgi:hypothetical protein
MMLNRFSKVWFNSAKGIAGYSNKVLVVLAVWDGVSIHLSKFSECVSLAMLEKTLFFAGTTLYDGRVVPNS